nr:hypothetical protein [Enterobacter roggenkampii]
MGFGVGIYVLPILTAEKNSSADEIKEVKNNARYTGAFFKNQKGSNAVHWVMESCMSPIKKSHLKVALLQVRITRSI